MTEISKSNLFAAKSSAAIAQFEAKEIERRLSLYQIFLKLYENHGGLLEDILELENLSLSGVRGLKASYVQGIVDDSVVYLVTNLGDNQTQTLLQSQLIWTVGRDRHSGICVGDKYLSRRHAAIQYLNNEHELGFYLVDFKSTNGSFVNGERVYKRILLKDGDRIRLGNMSFNFFYNHTCRILPTVAIGLLMQLASRKGSNTDDDTLSNFNPEKYLPKTPGKAVPFVKNSRLDHQPVYDGFSVEQKSDILDRFFSTVSPYPASREQ